MRQLNTYIKKNDLVYVIAGKEKKKSGKVLKIIPEKSRVLVEKLNMVKVHQKPTAKNRQGGIIQKEAGIHVSNLLLYCNKCSKGVRVSLSQSPKGKIRICKKCGEEISTVK